MRRTEGSIMVVLDREEYCFLYDRQSLPELIEALLDHDPPRAGDPPGSLTREQAREIARRVLGRAHQDL